MDDFRRHGKQSLATRISSLAMAAFVATAFVTAAPAEDRRAAAEASKPGNTASLWTESFKDLKDQPKKLDSYKGKVAVVYFWATWCVPCRLETPKLVKLYARFKSKDVVVIGIALDNADKVRAFAEANGVTYPVVYGGSNAIQVGRDLGNDKGAVPFTVIIGKDGKIVQTIRGDTPDGKLEAILAPLVG